MRLTKILEGLEAEQMTGPDAGALEVCRVTADSREAGPGALFVAVPGARADGHDFAARAAKAGCSAVLLERRVPGLEDVSECAVFLVPRAREALALCAANLHGRPAERLSLVGVTGTNGKTTVAWLLSSALEHSGLGVGLLGTIGVRRKGEVAPSTHTTPSPEILQEMLGSMIADGVRVGVMEVSSHALDQDRVTGCRFDAVAFTNLSRDHLDYHRTIEDYYLAKRRLFTDHLADDATAVVVLDDAHGRRLHGELTDIGSPRLLGASVAAAMGRRTPEALDPARGVMARSATLDLGGTRAEIDLPCGARCVVESALVGEHNLANLVVAAGLAWTLGLSADEIGAGLSSCAAVPGRLERVADPMESEGGSRHLFVDYAHTSDALERVIRGLRGMAPASSRLIVVMGCGGDRDKGKRPLMAKAASLADVVVVTSDNPRSEDPDAIVADMLPGLVGSAHLVELDRAAAIAVAAGMARPGDVVLVAGKGHEATQASRDGVRAFDDREVSSHALAGVRAGSRDLPGGDAEL